MKVIHYTATDKKPNTKNLAVALGYFDGVHVGHRALISELIRISEEDGLSPCVFTFANLPPKTQKTPTTLYNIDDKLKIFEQLGIEIVILADFDSISAMSGEEFVKDVLIGDFDTRVALCGFNFRFGRCAHAGAADLVELMSKHGTRAEILDEQTVGDVSVSATEIKNLLSEGKIEGANALLGTPYFVRGKVEKGLGLGKAYGFPTVNTPIRSDSPLLGGVYRTAVRIGEKLYTGVTNVGTCPTIEKRDVHAETLISDFEGSLYGQELYIYFLGYMRKERLFDSVDRLRDQIYADKEQAEKENGDLKWLEIGLSSP